MRKQKILFNTIFPERRKKKKQQILRSALPLLSEPIKADGDSKAFSSFLPAPRSVKGPSDARRGGRRVGRGVSAMSDPPEHLPPLLGAHAGVFILNAAGGGGGGEGRYGADRMRYPPF